MTIGMLYCPPDMYDSFAAEFTIWSSASSAKLKVIISTTGRSPTIAAPIPIPVNPDSAIGVSTMRFGPKSFSSPWVTLYAPSYRPTSSPITNTLGSRSISSRSARLSASRYVITAISGVLLVDVGEEPLVRRFRRGIGKRDGFVDPVVDVLLDRLHVGFGESAGVDRLRLEQHDRIAQLLALDFFLGAIDRAGGVAHRVPAEPVRARLDQTRRAVLARALDGRPDRRADGEQIHPVDRLGRHVVRLAEFPDLGLR